MWYMWSSVVGGFLAGVGATSIFVMLSIAPSNKRARIRIVRIERMNRQRISKMERQIQTYRDETTRFMETMTVNFRRLG
jgi:hypothetical protein